MQPKRINLTRSTIEKMAVRKVNHVPTLNSDLKSLVTFSNTDFSSIDDVIANCIKFGIDKIGFEVGVVNKLNENDCQTLHLTNLNKLLKNDRIVPLCNTLCKKIAETKSTLISRNLEDILSLDLPTHTIFDIETIICTPIIVGQKLFGSLIFCNTQANPKNHQWKYYIKLIEALAQLIGKFLKEQNDKNALKTKSKYLEQFNSD